jgi:hypothetical protein
MFLLQDDRVQIEDSASLIFLFLWDFPNVRVISSSSYSMVKTVISLLSSTQWFFLCPQPRRTSLRIFRVENKKDKMFDAMFWCWIACMYPYLVWNISPLSLTLHCYKVSLFVIQSLLVLLIHRLIHVLAFNSDACGVPILGCPWWLLLSLFLKLDHTSKCGVARFIM